MTDDVVPKAFVIETAVRADRDRVWETVTQPPVIAQWFGWDHDGLEAEIQQIFVDLAVFDAPEQMSWPDGSYLEVTGDDSATVRVVRDGPPPGPGEYDALAEGWKVFLVQLKFLLERQPAGRRRTLHLTGETTGRQVLGLVDGDWSRLDERVAWSMGADGHLVTVSAHGSLDGRDATVVQVVVSTFGLSDDQFAAVRDEWRRRWATVAG